VMRSIAAAALGNIGPASKPAVPSLVELLGDEAEFVRSSAAFALGGIGRDAKAGIPALINALKDPDVAVRRQAPESLAEIGPEAKVAIPALVDALRDPDEGVREYAAVAMADLSSSLNDAKETDAIGLLKTAHEALAQSREEGVNKHADTVKRSIGYLELLGRGQVGQWFLNHPVLTGIFSLYALLLLTCLTLLWRRPLWLLKINEALSPYADVKLPLLATGLNFPLRQVILVGFFHYHPRVLDAWVAQHVATARRAFSRRQTVEARQVYAPAPVALGEDVLHDVTVTRFRPLFTKNVACLLIHGEGGSGKTSIACLLARWAMEEDEGRRLRREHLMLPVLIEQDAELQAGGDREEFLKIINTQLRVLVDGREHLPAGMLINLLKRQRVLIIVDGISEMSESFRQVITSAVTAVPANAVIVTSRNEEPLGGMPRASIRPLKIRVARLMVFVDAYLGGRGKRELFEDEEYLDAGQQLLSIAGERGITPLLAKLFLDQLIAGKEGGTGDDLPDNVPDLMLKYLTTISRGPSLSPDVRVIIGAAKAVAWECLKEHYRPVAARRDDAHAALTGDADPSRVLDHLEERLRIIETAGVARDRIRFALDPLCEYLAGLHLVETLGDSEGSWLDFLSRVDDQGDPELIKGFLLAVRDCCTAAGANTRVLDQVAAELAKRVGIDVADKHKLRIERRARRLLRDLKLPDAEDRVEALKSLRGMYVEEKSYYPVPTPPLIKPEASTVVPALIKMLGDVAAPVRQHAAGVVKEIGPRAQAAVPSLINALSDQERGVRMGAALALGVIGPGAAAAVPALIEALEDEAVRLNAAGAIGHIGAAAKEAAPALIKALKDSEEGLRANAAAALGSIAPDAETAVPALTGALTDTNNGVRMNAANSLARFGRSAEPSIPDLIYLLKDPDKYVRIGAANAMAAICCNDRAVRDALLEMSQDPDQHVRSSAVYALGKINASRSDG
jgi:HEAT repeat protein